MFALLRKFCYIHNRTGHHPVYPYSQGYGEQAEKSLLWLRILNRTSTKETNMDGEQTESFTSFGQALDAAVAKRDPDSASADPFL